MAGKREKPEDIVSKLRQVEVLQGQGMTISQAVRDYILILANTVNTDLNIGLLLKVLLEFR